jgi:hypothetical protein
MIYNLVIWILAWASNSWSVDFTKSKEYKFFGSRLFNPLQIIIIYSWAGVMVILAYVSRQSRTSALRSWLLPIFPSSIRHGILCIVLHGRHSERSRSWLPFVVRSTLTFSIRDSTNSSMRPIAIAARWIVNQVCFSFRL